MARVPWNLNCFNVILLFSWIVFPLFEFIRGVEASNPTRTISAVYREDVIWGSVAWEWFSCFHFDVIDSPFSERLSDFDKARLNALIHCPRQSTQELASMVDCDQLIRHLHSMGKYKKWVYGYHIFWAKTTKIYSSKFVPFCSFIIV